MSDLLRSSVFVFHDIMMKFQKENNIKSECIANTQFFLEGAKKICSELNEPFIFRPEAVTVVYPVINSSGQKCQKLHSHMVVIMGDHKIIDPSYEVFSQKDSWYFGDAKSLCDFEKSIHTDYYTGDLRKDITTALKNTLSLKVYETHMENDIFNPEYTFEQLKYVYN